MTTEQQQIATPSTGAQSNAGQASQTAQSQFKAGDNIGGTIVHHVDERGRPFVDPAWLAQFPQGKNGARILPAQTRIPSMKPISVIDVRPYVDRRGLPRVAFNRGSIHISAAQLSSAGVINPLVLVGKHILVDFFKRGDVLLNGSIVTQDGVIVNQFALEVDTEVASKLEYELQKEKLTSWLGLATMAYGANNRGAGMGTQQNIDNGVTPVSQNPAMQNPATSTNSNLIDQRFQSPAPEGSADQGNTNQGNQ